MKNKCFLFSTFALMSILVLLGGCKDEASASADYRVQKVIHYLPDDSICGGMTSDYDAAGKFRTRLIN